MKDSEKISLIEKVFEMYHDDDDEFDMDSIDALMRIESILRRD